MKPISLSVLISMLLIACRPAPDATYCPATYKCVKANSGIKFEGYQLQETDTILITTYVKDGTFKNVIDSMYHYSQKIVGGDNSDYYDQRYKRLISSDYDYDVFVPVVNRHYRISDIVHSTDSTVFYTACAGNGKYAPFPGCSYYPVSGVLDGVTVYMK